jgi:SSS family solute:Na+ symporter
MAGVPMTIFIPMMIAFVAVTIVLGLYGYRNTKKNQHFLLGRNKATSALIALSYGATFLSTSAIIGFGGQAATHGLTLLWLCFLNLALGLLVPFIIFAPRVRRIGRKLGASTFADLLGKIYKSKGIRVFTAALVIIMMPIYAAAVLKGGVNALAVTTGMLQYYDAILILVAIIVGLYVVYGGILAVMYNDVLQAAVMIVGMVIIFAVTIAVLPGGLSGGLSTLSDTSIFTAFPGTRPGMTSFAGVPSFLSEEWWLVVSTFLLGVGIGAMTQPQLVARFMSAKDDKMLNRSLMIGSIFILVIVGIAYTVGALTNVYFFEEYGVGSFKYITDPLYGHSRGVDFIIPQYVLEVFSGLKGGDIFICAFIMSLLCAAVSTLSALMHTIGAAGGHDVYSVVKSVKNKEEDDAQAESEDGTPVKKEKDKKSLKVNRSVTAISMVLVVVYCYLMPADIIAKATSLFMGMTAAALLPLMAYGLFSKDPNKKVVIPSMIVGASVYVFWALFINRGSSIFLPICKMLTGKQVLFDGVIGFVDALVIALPLSAITLAIMILLNRMTAKPAA